MISSVAVFRVTEFAPVPPTRLVAKPSHPKCYKLTKFDGYQHNDCVDLASMSDIQANKVETTRSKHSIENFREMLATIPWLSLIFFQVTSTFCLYLILLWTDLPSF